MCILACLQDYKIFVPDFSEILDTVIGLPLSNYTEFNFTGTTRYCS